VCQELWQVDVPDGAQHQHVLRLGRVLALEVALVVFGGDGGRSLGRKAGGQWGWACAKKSGWPTPGAQSAAAAHLLP
jgi:hypothetical protein